MRGAVELETFLGSWRDSMGHHVKVEWARPGNRGGQLNVLLTKPRSDRDPIRLNVQQHRGGRFTCGHYDLDTEQSDARRIVWADCKQRGKVSVWDRDAEASPHRAHHGRDRSSSRPPARDGERTAAHGWWDRGGNSGNPSQSGAAHGGGGGRSRSRSRGRDASHERGHSRAQVPGAEGGRPHRDGEASNGARRPDDRRDPSGDRHWRGDEPPRQSEQGHACNSQHNGWPDAAWSQMPPPHPCGPWGGHGLHYYEAAAVPGSLWSGAPTPGAWVPPTAGGGPPPGPPVHPGHYPPPALGPWGAPMWAAPPAEPPPTNWAALIEAMYQRYNPAKLSELEDILSKYRGREAELYRALCQKYGLPGEWMARPPQCPAQLAPGVAVPLPWSPPPPQQREEPPPADPPIPPALQDRASTSGAGEPRADGGGTE